MHYHIDYIEENGYLIRKFTGKLLINDLLMSWTFVIENYLKKKKYIGVLSDFREAEIKIRIDDLNSILEILKKNEETFKDLKLAIVMTSPNNIIFPILAQRESTFKIKPFSTMFAAKEWLLTAN